MKKNLIWGALCAALFVPFTSCNNDDDKGSLTKDSYNLYHDGTATIEGTDLDEVVWDSDNEFVATVENNVITGQYVGTTVVTGGKLEFTVTVAPRYTYYTEPIDDFGKSSDQVIAAYGQPDLNFVSEDGVPVYLYVVDNEFAPIVMFTFNNGVVETSGVYVDFANGSDLTNFLTERYVTIEVDETDYSVLYAHLFGKVANPSVDMAVEQELDDEDPTDISWLVAYALTTNSTKGVNDVAKKAMHDALEAYGK